MYANEKVKELIQQSATWDNDYRASICRGALQSIVEELDCNSKEDIRNFVVALIRVGVSADRSCDQAELDLYRAAIDPEIKGQDFYEMTNGGRDPELIEAIDENIDHFTDDAKFACCTLVLCFITADHKVTDEEAKLIQKLFA